MRYVDESAPAFPTVGECQGMSLRDYFANGALPLARAQADKAGQSDIDRLFPGTGSVTRDQIAARLAYKMADAMLAERLVTPDKGA